MRRKFTLDAFKIDGYELLNMPKKYKDRAEIKHLECGRVFNMRGDAFVMMGQRCPYCYSKKAPTPDEYRASLPMGFTTDDDYVGRDVNMLFKHICGRDFIMTPHNFARVQYCPHCNNDTHNKERIEKFTKIINMEDPEYELVGEYFKSLTPTKFKHKTCGCIFDMTPNAFLYGSRCPSCRYKESRGEKCISNLLAKYNIKYTRQHVFPECKSYRTLPFDFAIFMDDELKFLIEFDGEQHFTPMGFENGVEKFNTTKMHDDIKTKFCEASNIPLYRITYLDNIEEKINEILGQYIITSGGNSCQDN